MLYSGLHLYEEAVLGFPLPLRERDRVRGKAVATNLLIQTKSAVDAHKGGVMHYGVVLPHVGPYAREQAVDRLQTVAQQAEALGFRSLWVGDHIVLPTQLTSKYPYHPEGKFPLDPADNFLEPLTVLSYVAACTTTIRLGTGVLIIPYRPPIVTAKMVATLDV